jgi:putative ABC transport system permease protein
VLRTTLAGLRARKLRLVATALAIVLGVGFVAGTLVFSDTAKAALYDSVARAAKNVDVAITPPRQKGKSDPELPKSTVDTVRGISGVDAVDGRMQEGLPLLDRNGKLAGDREDPGIALSAGTVPSLRPYDMASGRAPRNTGEAALDKDTASRLHYAVGDRVTVLDSNQKRHGLSLVGIVSFGESKQYADQSVVVLTDPDITTLTGSDGYHQVVVSGKRADLAGRISAALGGGVVVRSGAAYRDALATDAISQFTSFTTVLLAFAVIACVVSAFVIYNTFNILVTQRVRDMALLRCVGASRRQIFGSVLLESALVGLLGAAGGIALGVGIGAGLFGAAGALGAGLPSHPIVLTVLPVVVALLLGVLVTVGSAVIPAWRATRVAPLSALNSQPFGRISRPAARVALVGLALLVGAGGTLLTVRGSQNHTDPQTATLTVVAGGIVNFLAILLLSPLFIGPLTAAIGWLPGRLFGTPARLAAANARRNPGRTAATTATLMIGVGLMSAASVAITTVQVTASNQLTSHYPIDYLISPQGPAGEGIPVEVADRLRRQSALGVVAEVRVDGATLDGRRTTLGAVDPLGQRQLIAATQLVSGSVADLKPGTVLLYNSAPEAAGKKVGDRVSIATEGGRSATLTVVAIASGRSETGSALVSWDQFATLHPTTTDTLILIRGADRVSTVDSRAAVDAVTNDYPLVSVRSTAEWRAQVTSAVDQLIAAIAALLGVAVLISLLGIMNTLSLSVFERTRESAMTRAIGLTKGQLRATLLVEALLMGMVGALVGVAFGVLYGWATSRVMFSGFTAVITVPVGQLAGYVAIAATAGVVAAVLPARRAARASIVSAMAET